MERIFSTYMKNKKIAALLTAFLLASTLFSCETAPSGDEGQGTGTNVSENEPAKTPVSSNSVAIRLEGDTVSCDDPSVYIADDVLTITSHGTYVVSGTWNNGQIRVECIDAGELNLVLDNASITNDDQACIVFWRAQRAILTLAEGSVNTLTDGKNYAFDNPIDDEPDAPLFSKEDLTITGTGSLTVDGNYKNGIVSKDGLKIENGTIEVSSAEHGIKGKDYLVINGGSVTVESLGDGIKTTNEESPLVGYIEINGGTVNIYSDDEAVQAVTDLTVNGGTVNIDSTNNGIRCGNNLVINGGTVNIDAEDNTIEAKDVTVSDTAAVTVLGFPYKG